jgi:hypothetical protein
MRFSGDFIHAEVVSIHERVLSQSSVKSEQYETGIQAVSYIERSLQPVFQHLPRTRAIVFLKTLISQHAIGEHVGSEGTGFRRGTSPVAILFEKFERRDLYSIRHKLGMKARRSQRVVQSSNFA